MLSPNQAPAPQAVKAATDFLDVIKLAGSKDVQVVLAQMREISDETAASTEKNQKLLSDIVAERAELAKDTDALRVLAARTATDKAQVAREQEKAQADRKAAAGVLASAREQADWITAEADKKLAEAEADRKVAERLKSAAERAQASAEADAAEAAATKAEWTSRKARLEAAVS